MLKSLLPDEVKVKTPIDDIGLRLNLTIKKSIRFTKMSFFPTILGFIQYHSGPSGGIEGFLQLIPGTYKSVNTKKTISVDKVHLKCDYLNGSIVNGCRQPILYSFALDQPPGHKIYKVPRIGLLKRLIKSLLSHIFFYLEDDDHKSINLNGETINFT